MSSDERQPLLVATRSKDGSTLDDRQEVTSKKLLVATAMLTNFLSTLDLTIVATCIPTISSALQTSDQEAWIGTAYLWSNVTFTPLYGRLSDLIGRRNAYLQALILFTIGTFLCGCAPTFPILVIARFIAGMGGGGMGTVASVLMSESFPAEDRAFYQGLTFAVFGAGIGLGGPIGGFLTQYFGWRAAFYAQVPVAAIALVLVSITVPRHKLAKIPVKETLKQIDFGGSFTLLVSIGALLQLLSRSGSDKPINQDPIGIAMAVIFPLFFILFIFVELKVAVKPVLPLHLLTQRTPLCVGIIAGVIAVVNFNMLYHLPTIFEIVFQKSLSTAGAHILPNSAAMAISPPLLGLIVKRTRRYKWPTVICCAGPVISMALIATLHPGSSWAIQWLSVLPMGAGFSGLLTLTLIAMLNAVDSTEIATATGFVFVWRSLGQVFGVGLSSAVYQFSLNKELLKSFKSEKVISKLRHASKAIDTLKPKQQEIARHAFGVALRNTFIFGLVGAVSVFITSLVIENKPLQDKPSVKRSVDPERDEPDVGAIENA